MEMKEFEINVSTAEVRKEMKIMIVAERVNSTASGNPVHLLSVFTYLKGKGYGYQWAPLLKGHRERKDGKYRIVGAQRSKEHMMRDFSEELQAHLEQSQ